MAVHHGPETKLLRLPQSDTRPPRRIAGTRPVCLHNPPDSVGTHAHLEEVMRMPWTRCTTVTALFVIIASALAGAEPALAQIFMRPTSMDLTANFNTIQAKLNYLGDDNEDAEVYARYWRTADGPTMADQGHDLVRDVARRRFCGTLFWLSENTSYTVELHAVDPDGIDTEIWTGSITTRATPPTPSAATRIYVATNGVDSPDCGGTPDSPCATIQQAHDRLPDGGGGQIVMRQGVYYQSASLFKIGTPTAPYSIVKENPGDSVVIYGSDPGMETGQWTCLSSRPNQCDGAIFLRPYVASFNAENPLSVVVAGWGQRLHRRTSLSDLTTTPDGYPTAGFYYNPDSALLYVRLENPTDRPNQLRMHVARPGDLLRVFGKNWIIDGITTRFANGVGIFLGANGTNPTYYADNAVIRNVTAIANGRGGVFGNTNTNNVLVEDCVFEDPRIDSWGYGPCKAHTEEGSHGALFFGRGWVVRRNVVRGTFDGIQCTGGPSAPEQSADSDVHDNIIDGVADDGLEFENGCGISLAAWHNVVNRANHGIATCPLHVGPMYWLYNTITNCDRAGTKNGGASYAREFLYHNTFTSSDPYDAFEDVGGGYSGKHYLNNILVGVRSDSVWFRFPVYGNSFEPWSCSFDYDLVYLKNTLPGTELQWLWDNTEPKNTIYSTLQELTAGTGLEAHGVVGAPAFVDSAHANYHLLQGSPGIDVGTLIRGINTPYWTVGRQLMYSGLAPDAGAFEYVGGGASPMHTAGPGTTAPGLSFAIGSSNPSTGSVRFEFRAIEPTSARLQAFDIAGRMVSSLYQGVLPAGEHSIEWDGRSDAGTRLPAGIYLVRLKWAGGVERKRIVLLP